MSSPQQPSRNVFDCRKIVRRADARDINAILHLAEASSMTAHWSPMTALSYCAAAEADNPMHAKVIFVVCDPAEPLSCLHTSLQSVRNVSAALLGFAALSAITGSGSGECSLENLAVAEAWRKQGIGARLLALGLLWCRAQSGCSLSLEVRAANLTAISFYERAGFAASGRRPGYYAQPNDDAILMWKSLDASLSTH